MLGWYAIFLSDWKVAGRGCERKGGDGQLKRRYLKLLEFFALVPTTFPSFLHSLDGHEPLVGVLRTCTRTTLHRGQRCIGG